MPMAEPRLRAIFGVDDVKALDCLSKDRFEVGNDFIIRPNEIFELTQMEADAIDFLCQEYDYGYER